MLEARSRSSRTSCARPRSSTPPSSTRRRARRLARHVGKDDKRQGVEYTIVGSTEADPANKRLSNESPVGKALIGRKKGDTVVVPAPKGERKLIDVKITKIAAAVSPPMTAGGGDEGARRATSARRS